MKMKEQIKLLLVENKELKQIIKHLEDEIQQSKNLNIPSVSKRLILENLLERMKAVYPEYYLGIIQDELDSLNGC